jgi:hypothetical protein
MNTRPDPLLIRLTETGAAAHRGGGTGLTAPPPAETTR